MPNPVFAALKAVYRKLHYLMRRTVSAIGWEVYPSRDFYSPIPVLKELEATREQWDVPSEMVGVEYDVESIKTLLSELVSRYGAEYQALPRYQDNKRLGLGPGFTEVDAMTLYFMIRHLKPRRYTEIGSGFSTYYAWLAVNKNREEGIETSFRVVDPFPREALKKLENIDLTISPVQDVDLAYFDELEAGDVFFIDTSHVLKVGGEVAYLYLEVVPCLKPGVTIHAHDIHFPYNVPHPAEQYVFRTKWPQVWTESMILQAFLAFNRDFEIVFSAPILRHFDPEFLKATVPDYRPTEVADYDTHFGSLWFRRTG
ncbi:MAG: class I SAM-dependent methyltransferase [bacterium]|nr:class I SAM-dependent methyltransferase [bacterium]